MTRDVLASTRGEIPFNVILMPITHDLQRISSSSQGGEKHGTKILDGDTPVTSTSSTNYIAKRDHTIVRANMSTSNVVHHTANEMVVIMLVGAILLTLLLTGHKNGLITKFH